MRLRATGAVALAAAMAAAGSGCAELRGGVVSETTACAQVVPLANQVVRGRGKLVQVHALKRSDAQKLLDSGVLRSTRRPPPKAPRKACLLVYHGRFHERGRRRPARYLVLFLRVRHPKVLSTYTADRLPAEIKRQT